MEIRHIKAKIRENLIYPETLVRYKPDSEWMELVDFLSDWIRLKATNAQINYLRSLQEERALSEEIPLDASRRDISARISALVPSREA